MDKEFYLKQFSKLIRWRLPTEEAEDAISDYAELLNAQSEEGEALLKKLGTPFAAAMQIKPAKEYYHWMAVFALLALCAVYLFCGLFAGWYWWYCITEFSTVLFYFAVGLTAFWKWKTPKEKRGKHLELLPAMLCMLIPIVLFAAISGFIFAMVSGLSNGNFGIPDDWIVPILSTALRLTGGMSLAAALVGLIRCRTRDRRWLSIVILSLLLLFLCVVWMWIMKSLDNVDAVLPAAKKSMVLPSIVGAVGVIWSLC